jgi:V8-like Glu-specific endopeptidase
MASRPSSGNPAMPDLAHYRSILQTGNPKPSQDPLEAAGGGHLDLSSSGIKERLETAGAQLHRLVSDHLNDRPELHEIADKIIKDGRPALELAADDDSKNVHPDLIAALEVIVRTDGSRPSFLVRRRTADLSTSPVGSWSSTMEASKDLLDRALGCVGRVDVPGAVQGFEGTAFLIHENLALTNRHVLQVVADEDNTGGWRVRPGVTVDFGHEFRTQEKYPRRAIKKVVFHGRQEIDENGPVDHAKLDLALFELEQAAPGDRPPMVLSVDVDPDWASSGKTVFIVGYPGSPRFGQYQPSLLEQLLQTTYGCKRVAPGLITASKQHVQPWTLAHDGTTLGGNSGSVVLVTGREHLAAGLHYGGRLAEPRENWGHVLGHTLDETDGKSPKTLRELFKDYGVDLVDRVMER